MTTVAQMIKWMKTLPQDAVVECGFEKYSSGEAFMIMKSVNISACDVFDFTGEEYTSEDFCAKYPHRAGQCFVEIRAE